MIIAMICRAVKDTVIIYGNRDMKNTDHVDHMWNVNNAVSNSGRHQHPASGRGARVSACAGIINQLIAELLVRSQKCLEKL